MTSDQVAYIMALVDKYANDPTWRTRQRAAEQRAAVEAALRDAPQAEPKRCPYCDDTGDVHSIDGQWRGTCTCPAGQATPSAPTAVEPPYPAATTLEGAAQDVAKWLNERPNSPLDLRHVAMLVHAVQASATAVEPDEREAWTDEGVDDLCWSAFESAMASGVSVDSFRRLANSLRAKQLPPRAARAKKGGQA